MSKHHHQQQNQQRAQQSPPQAAQSTPVDKPAEWRPSNSTRFLIPVEPEIAKRARAFLTRKYTRPGLKLRMLSEINTLKISPRTEIVMVFEDGEDFIHDEKTGEFRQRRGPVKQDGRVVVPAEPSAMKVAKPIDCSEFFADDDGDAEDEDVDDGVKLFGKGGLIEALNQESRPLRVRYDDRNHVLQLRST